MTKMNRWVPHLDIEAAVILIKAINKAVEDVEDPELRTVVKEIGEEIIKNLRHLIKQTRETS
jgi:hypothetical protein